jgi:hypothetical protein
MAQLRLQHKIEVSTWAQCSAGSSTIYESLIEVCRQRAAELAISREGIDVLSGCAPGLAGKILGHRQVKKLGPTTLKPMLQVLGLKLLVIEDDRETSLTLSIREPVQASQQRFGVDGRARYAQKKLPPPEPVLTIVHSGRMRHSKYG